MGLSGRSFVSQRVTPIIFIVSASVVVFNGVFYLLDASLLVGRTRTRRRSRRGRGPGNISVLRET